MKKKDNKRVWIWARIAFYTFIISYILLTILNNDLIVTLFVYLASISGISTFVLSIIHLRMYKQKGFAITALVLSSILILILFISMIYGILLGIVGK